MKCFLAYRASEADLQAMKKLLLAVRNTLNSIDIDTYSVLLDYTAINENSGREFMDCAFKEIDKSDFILVIQNFSERSEGMLMEVGYCIAKNIPIVVAKQNKVDDTYLPEMTKYNLSWNDTEDLLKKLVKFKFSKLDIK